MAFSDYSNDPNANTSVSGTNIGENCPPGNVNNAIRQVMADLRTAFSRAAEMLVFFQSGSLAAARANLHVIGDQGAESMKNDLQRDGGGAHLYNVDAGMTHGGVFLTPAGTSDPTGGQPGVWWLTY